MDDSSGKVFLFGPFRLDVQDRELSRAGQPIPLSPKEFDTLLVLVESHGRLVGRDRLVARVWPDAFVGDGSLARNISILRKALGNDLIETVPKVGYRLRAAVTCEEAGQRSVSEESASKRAIESGSGHQGFSAARGRQKAKETIGHPRFDLETEEEGKQAPETVASISPSEHGDGRSQMEEHELEAQSQPSFSRRRWRIWLAGAGVAALAIVAGAFYYPKKPPSPPRSFQSRDLVLITSFENHTAEKVLDGTLEYALERELTNSRFVSAVPRERIDDTLVLMRMPADTRVDAALGRQICLRDGGIRAMITGRIDKFGSTYVLGVELEDPTSGRAVASFEEQANSQAEILTEIHVLSDHLRQSLGEHLSQIRQSNLALQNVTTPSLKALQLYSEADQEIRQDEGMQVAFQLLKQAIAEDPNFASAYIQAAFALANLQRPPSEYMPYAKRALELSHYATPAERYYIEGSYYDFTNQLDRAAAAYEALLRIDPDNYWGASNLTGIYEADGRPQELINLGVRLPEVRPNGIVANFVAGYVLSIMGENTAAAQPYMDRAMKLLSLTSHPDPGITAGLLLYPAYLAWMKGDLPLTEADLKRVEQGPYLQNDLSLRQFLAWFAVTLGQTRRANDWFQRSSPMTPGDDFQNYALLAYVRGDHADLIKLLRRAAGLPGMDALPSTIPLSLMTREGLFPEAEAFMPRSKRDNEAIKLARGELLVAEGNTAEGMPLLSESVQRLRNTAYPTYFLGAESLARAYLKQGNTKAALAVLESASANRPRVAFELLMAGAPFWMRDEMDLAHLYRRLGRVRDAEKIEGELRKLLADADPDFPMVVELKRLEKAPAPAPLPKN